MKQIRFSRVEAFRFENGIAIFKFNNDTVARNTAAKILQQVDVTVYRINATVQITIGFNCKIEVNEEGYFITFR